MSLSGWRRLATEAHVGTTTEEPFDLASRRRHRCARATARGEGSNSRRGYDPRSGLVPVHPPNTRAFALGPSPCVMTGPPNTARALTCHHSGYSVGPTPLNCERQGAQLRAVDCCLADLGGRSEREKGETTMRRLPIRVPRMEDGFAVVSVLSGKYSFSARHDDPPHDD